jgi:parvulin-like peptidyl-prolyl isomerase
MFLGCEGPGYKGDPVAPPPPPRIGAAANGQAELQPNAGGVRLASNVEPPGPARQAQSNQPARRNAIALVNIDPAEEGVASEVVARVNGEVIFARECLEPVRKQLEQAREQLPTEAFETLRKQLIREYLPKVLERKVLAAEARRNIAESARKQVELAAEEAFQKKLRSVLQISRTATETEVSARLEESGLSLQELRKRHEEEFLGQQYLRAKIADRTNLSRRELLEHYDAHQDEFARPARVKWQHIEVPAADSPSRLAARRRADELAALLNEGADFGLLAKWHSKGPTAGSGGNWDWTTKGSYATPSVDHFLFQGRVGTVSPVLEGARGYHLVKILVREPEHVVPFEQVQDEIREQLQQQRLSAAAKELVREQFKNAHIETLFDADPTFLSSLPHGAEQPSAKR